MSTGRVFVLIALVAAVAPSTSRAYKIVCDASKGFDVIVCNDNQNIQYICLDCNGPCHQYDCTEEDAKEMCSDHGGMVRIEHAGVLEACEYKGSLDLTSLKCEGCSPDEPAPTCSARWVGGCGDNTTFACNEADECFSSMPKEIDQVCSRRGGTVSSAWYVGFQLRLECDESVQTCP
jgi:hypothetical protein